VRTIDTYYSDVDINGHINSIKYIEHILDLFPREQFAGHRLRRFDIAYKAESYLGDTLTFICQAADDLTPRNPSTAYDIVIRKNVGAPEHPEGDSIIQAKVSWM
jgi:acyl-ACP thioesterase